MIQFMYSNVWWGIKQCIYCCTWMHSNTRCLFSVLQHLTSIAHCSEVLSQCLPEVKVCWTVRLCSDRGALGSIAPVFVPLQYIVWLPTRGRRLQSTPVQQQPNKFPPINTASEICPWLFLTVLLQWREHWSLPDRQTFISETLRQKHTVHCFFSLCGRSLNRAAAWWKLSGNFSLSNPKECDSKRPLSERKIPSLWALDWEAETSHSAEHTEGNIQLRLLKERHKPAN